MAQAQVKLGLPQDCLINLGMCKQTLADPKYEGLIPHMLLTGIEAAKLMMQQVQPKPIQDLGASNKIGFINELMAFFEKKEKWDKYLEYVDELLALLTNMDRFQDVENLQMRIFGNQKLPSDRRHRAIINIFNIPFHKPKVKLNQALLNEIVALNPESPENFSLIIVILRAFDKRPKFAFYENKLNELPQYMQEVKEFLSLAVPYFYSKDITDEKVAEVLVKSELSLFFKFLVLQTITQEQTTSSWRDLVAFLLKLVTTNSFKLLLVTDTSYALFTLVNVILDVDASLYTIHSGTYISKLPQEYQAKELSALKTLIGRKMTPLANLIYCEHILNYGGSFKEAIELCEGGVAYVQDLRNAKFVQGFEQEAKMLIIKSKMLTSKRIDLHKDKIAREFEVASTRLRQLTSLAANFNVINQELPLMLYNYKLSNEGLKGAREYLEELENGLGAKSGIKEDWIKSQKAWLIYSFIDEIEPDRSQQSKLIEGVYVLLKDALALNSQNFEIQQRIGTVIFNYEAELGLQAKQASINWLTALKSQPNNADIFYSLGLYYHFVDKDLAKALRCLEKAILLKPDHEDAGIFLYQLMIESGQILRAFAILQQIQQLNPLLAYPYYYIGLRAQNSGDYAQARLQFENAARYHNFYAKSADKTKPSYPLLKDTMVTRGNKQGSAFSRDLGIFSPNGVSIWIHLTEVYCQLEKYPTAEKCMKQILIQLDNFLETKIVSHSEEQKVAESQDELSSKVLVTLKPFADIGFLSEDLKILAGKVSTYFRSTQSEATLQLDILEILLLSAKVETFNRRFHHSLVFSSFALENLLKCDFPLKETFQWECYQTIIDTLLQLIDENLGGKADRKQIEKKKCVNALSQIVNFLGKHIDSLIISNERLAKLLANALKVVGEEYKQVELVKRAITIIERLLKETNVKQVPQYIRGLQMDLARLYHLIDLVFPIETEASYKEKKVQIVRQLIKENPAKGEYWIYYGIFASDEDVKLRSYYKALQLNPKDQFALNNILCLHMRNKNYRQAFKVLNHLRDLDSLNALVIALMVILNARVSLETPDISDQEKKLYLEQAISIGDMFLEIEQEKLDQADVKITQAVIVRDSRVDIHQFLSTQMNYIVTLMKHEINDPSVCSIDINEIIEERLAESPQVYLSKLSQREKISRVGDISNLEKIIQTSTDGVFKQGFDAVVSVIEAIKEVKEQELNKAFQREQDNLFRERTDFNALKVIAIQEKFIQANITPKNLLIEEITKLSDFKSIVDELEPSVSAKYVHQSIQLYFSKYPFEFSKIAKFSDILDENMYDSLKKTLPGLEYEKIFQLYLLNSLNMPQAPIAFRKELKRVCARNIEKIRVFLEEVFGKEAQRVENCKLSVVKYPQVLEGYNLCLWKIIRDGNLEQAKKFSEMIDFKVKENIIITYNDSDLQLFGEYKLLLEALITKNPSLLSSKVISPHLAALIANYISITSGQAKDQDQSKSLDTLVDKLILPWLQASTQHDELLEDQLNLLYALFNKFLLHSGYKLVFNELGAKILAKLGEIDGLNSFFADELRLYLMINMASNASSMGKKAQANSLTKQVEEFLKEGSMHQRRWCIRLFRGSLNLSLNQVEDAQKKFQSISEQSYEKDILIANTYLMTQEYKKFYLACIEIVTQLKEEQKTGSFNRVEAENLAFLLGYSYFMKANAELTFMEARKQKIVLKEDFSEKESQLFTVEYFKNKALKSLNKSATQFQPWKDLTEFVIKKASSLQ